MDKENSTRPARGYAAAALQRKQAATTASNNVPLPRVAALAASSGRSSRQRSSPPQQDGRPGRPLSSLGGSVAPVTRPPSTSVHRVGFKPATHSTRTMVPLLDVTAPGRAPLAPVSAASCVPAVVPAPVPMPLPAASSTPAASIIGGIIGDPTLDSAEQALQQELAQADHRLELLQSQYFRRRSPTPEHGAASASSALSTCGATPPQSVPSPPPPLQPVGQHEQVAPREPVGEQPLSGRDELQQSQPPQHAQQQQQEDLMLSPMSPEPPPPPPIPPEDQSIVRSVVTATGNSCKDVIAGHTTAVLPAGACWTTRGHRVLHLESSCILQLYGHCTSDITLRITFADATSVPRLVRLEHATSPTSTFERLGDIQLQPKSLKQLRHLFRLGKSLEVQRFLRITLVGHMAQDHSGAHRVSHMLLTSGHGPQRTPSPQPDCPSTAGISAAPSAQASVDLGKPPETSTADSAGSEGPPPSAAVPAEPARSSVPCSTQAPAAPAAAPAAIPKAQIPLHACPAAAAAAPGRAVEALPRGQGVASAASSTSYASASSADQHQQSHQAVATKAAIAEPTKTSPVVPQPAVPQPVMAQPAAVHSADVQKAAPPPAPSHAAVAQPAEVHRTAPQQPPVPSATAHPAAAPSLSQLLPPQGVHGEGAMWGSLDDGRKAEVDFSSLAAEFGTGSAEASLAQPAAAPAIAVERLQGADLQQGSSTQQEEQEEKLFESGAQQARASLRSPSLMLLPMQRCSNVAAVLSKLNLTPKQASEALLRLLGASRQSGGASELGADQVEELLLCLPSADERRLLAGFGGQPDQLGSAEQFMLEMLHVPAAAERLQAWRFAGQVVACADAAGAVAAVLGSACLEVAQSDLLRTLLKVALMAGNFLNAGNQNGAAAGFQIDALLKLKDVRSSRARSRTLLHFVAREVARQHPECPSLRAALPSAAAAARLDLATARADLLELTAGARRVEQEFAAALQGVPMGCSACAAAAAHLAAFRADVVESLAALLSELDDAEAAFRHLGSFINGQRATLAEPTAFFSVLHTFAQELNVAHHENAAADAAASGATNKSASGRSKDGKPRRQGEGTGSAASTAGSLDSRQRRSSSGVSISQERAGSAGPEQSSDDQEQESLTSNKEALLERLKQASVEGLQMSVPASAVAGAQQRKQHSPQPCLSKAALAGIGGSRRGASAAGAGSRAGQQCSGSPPGKSGAGAPAGQADDSSAGDAAKLSTPVAALLAESARLISSVDCGEGGFGSITSAVGSSAAEVAAGAAQDTAATPDGAVRPAALAGEEELEPGYSTPRDAVAQRWQGQLEQQYQQQAEAARQQMQGPPAAAAAPAATVAAAQAAVERPMASQAGSLASRGTGLSQLRQRSLQQLSPTSTPLSSLGRQSSHCSSAYSSDCSGATPRSSLRIHGSLLRHSSSPLGLGPAVAAAEGQAAAAAAEAVAAAAAAQPSGTAPPAEAQPQAGERFCAEQTATPLELPAAHEPLELPLGHDARQLPGGGSGLSAADSMATKGDARSQQGQPTETGQHGDNADGVEEGGEVLPPRPAGGFGALHSRASSCDLTYYAPFSMDREPSAFVAPTQQAPQGLSASFCYGQSPASTLGPLGAHQLRASTLLRHASIDESMLSGAEVAAARVHGSKYASLSMPSSPRHGAEPAAAARRPPPLNLRGLADRLQVHAPHQAPAAAPSAHSSGNNGAHLQQQQQQLVTSNSLSLHQQQGSTVEDVLPPGLAGCAGTPGSPLPGQPELAADDLADLAGLVGFSSDHEVEWQQLQQLEQQDAEWQQRQAAEREAREMILAQHPVYGRQAHPAEWAGQQEAKTSGAASMPQLTQQPAGGEGQEADEAAQLAALAALPSPINSSTSNLDAAVARLLATAGHTPTGPLGLGMRGGAAARDVHNGHDAAQAAAMPPVSVATAAPNARKVALLEPVLPAPLGEGIRASYTLSEHVPPAALLMSLECSRATLRRSLSAAQQPRSDMLTAEGAEWEAAVAAAEAARDGHGAGLPTAGAVSFPHGSSSDAATFGSMEWGGGAGPVRRRGLRKFMSARGQRRY